MHFEKKNKISVCDGTQTIDLKPRNAVFYHLSLLLFAKKYQIHLRIDALCLVKCIFLMTTDLFFFFLCNLNSKFILSLSYMQLNIIYRSILFQNGSKNKFKKKKKKSMQYHYLILLTHIDIFSTSSTGCVDPMVVNILYNYCHYVSKTKQKVKCYTVKNLQRILQCFTVKLLLRTTVSAIYSELLLFFYIYIRQILCFLQCKM